jgi:hypothetical protein
MSASLAPSRGASRSEVSALSPSPPRSRVVSEPAESAAGVLTSLLVSVLALSDVLSKERGASLAPEASTNEASLGVSPRSTSHLPSTHANPEPQSVVRRHGSP